MRLIILITVLFLQMGCSSTPQKPLYAASVLNVCTTTPEIYTTSKIRTNGNMSHALKRAAILATLESAPSTSFFGQYFKGDWVFEEETSDAIFIGYSVRSHYIKIAAIYQKNAIHTIICDSMNMKQTDDEIHGKAAVWKNTYNEDLREQLAEVYRNRHTLEDAKANKIVENIDFYYNDQTNKGRLAVKGKSLQDRAWMLAKIAEVCATKNVGLSINHDPKGGRFIVLDESIKDGVFTIDFEVVY